METAVRVRLESEWPYGTAKEVSAIIIGAFAPTRTLIRADGDAINTHSYALAPEANVTREPGEVRQMPPTEVAMLFGPLPGAPHFAYTLT